MASVSNPRQRIRGANRIAAASSLRWRTSSSANHVHRVGARIRPGTEALPDRAALDISLALEASIAGILDVLLRAVRRACAGGRAVHQGRRTIRFRRPDEGVPSAS